MLSGHVNVEPYLNISTYKTTGNELRLQDQTQVYASGKPQSKNGVIIIPDTLGWNTGRVRNLCDFFGDQQLYAVIPNFSSKGIEGQTETYMESSGIGDWYKSRTFDGNIKPVIRAVVSFMKSQGVEKISLLGFGWGSWVAVNLLASDDLAEEFYCAALSSPSIDLEEKVYGGSLPELMSRVKRPLLLMPTQGDPDHYKAYLKLLKYKLSTSQVIDYHDVEANFMLRGNCENEAIRNAMEKCTNEILCFFQQHFPMHHSELMREVEHSDGRALHKIGAASAEDRTKPLFKAGENIGLGGSKPVEGAMGMDKTKMGNPAAPVKPPKATY